MAANSGNKIRNAKLVLLGDVGAGKSSLVLRFVKGQFVEFQESTIGAAFFSQTLAVNDETVKFEIWDTAGQERYHSLAPMYYRGAAAAIVVYDITNPVSRTSVLLVLCYINRFRTQPPSLVQRNGSKNFKLKVFHFSI
nr:unnamed protein product [Digitaria exilis]